MLRNRGLLQSQQSTDGREARLQRVRSAQETKDCCGVNERERGPSSASKECSGAQEREARLQHRRDAWQRRVTFATPEQIEARQDRNREYHTQLEAVEPSQLHNPHIHLKMKEFHSKLSTLKVSTCVTCLEGFPG